MVRCHGVDQPVLSIWLVLQLGSWYFRWISLNLVAVLSTVIEFTAKSPHHNKSWLGVVLVEVLSSLSMVRRWVHDAFRLTNCVAVWALKYVFGGVPKSLREISCQLWRREVYWLCTVLDRLKASFNHMRESNTYKLYLRIDARTGIPCKFMHLSCNPHCAHSPWSS